MLGRKPETITPTGDGVGVEPSTVSQQRNQDPKDTSRIEGCITWCQGEGLKHSAQRRIFIQSIARKTTVGSPLLYNSRH